MVSVREVNGEQNKLTGCKWFLREKEVECTIMEIGEQNNGIGCKALMREKEIGKTIMEQAARGF